MAALAKPAGSLARYDAMVSAIAECARVDEVKDIRDKAVALEAYYRQAKNTEAEIEAANVRLRAERRAGELLKELARAETASGGDVKSASATAKPIPTSPYAAALERNGMSYQTAHKFQALANVPAETFEKALSGPERPSARRILREVAAPQPRVNDKSLWLWGRLRDLENDGYFDLDANELLDGMTDAMRADVRRLVPMAREFLETMEVCIDRA